MSSGFDSSNEACADAHAICPGRHHRSHCTRGAYPAGGKHGYVDRLQNVIKQCQGADLSADVAACSNALCDDKVAADVCCQNGLGS